MADKGVWRTSARLQPEKKKEKAGKERANGDVVILLVFLFAVFAGLMLGYAVPPLGIWLGRP